MAEAQGIRMKNPAHPGGFVKSEVIEALELSVTGAARALGVTRAAAPFCRPGPEPGPLETCVATSTPCPAARGPGSPPVRGASEGRGDGEGPVPTLTLSSARASGRVSKGGRPVSLRFDTARAACPPFSGGMVVIVGKTPRPTTRR